MCRINRIVNNRAILENNIDMRHTGITNKNISSSEKGMVSLVERQIKEMTLVMHGTRTDVTALWSEEHNKYLVFPNKDIEGLLDVNKLKKKTQRSL